MFTNEEFRFIEKAVGAYLSHEEVVNLKKEIISKIRSRSRFENLYQIFSGSVMETNDAYKPHLKVALMDKGDAPLFRFISCPNYLQINNILPSTAISYNDIYLQVDANGLRVNNGRFGTTGINVQFNTYESEVILAFLLYHKLKERGIDNSGLEPEKYNT